MKTYIIDDECISIYLTKYTLTAEGFSNDITSFQSAEEALDFFAGGNTRRSSAIYFPGPEYAGYEWLGISG